MYRVVSFLFLISAAYGQLQLEGACNFTNIPIENNLNVAEILGTWYQVARINNTYEKGECASITFTYRNDSAVPYIYVSNQEVVNGELSSRNGTISATLFGLNAIYADGQSFNFMVSETDYRGYAVVYSCTEKADGRSVLAWQYSRAVIPSVNTTLTIKSVINAIPDLANATWIVPSHSEEACKTSAAVKISSIMTLLFIGLYITKEF